MTKAAKNAVIVLTEHTSVERLRELAAQYAATSRETVRAAIEKTSGQASGSGSGAKKDKR